MRPASPFILLVLAAAQLSAPSGAMAAAAPDDRAASITFTGVVQIDRPDVVSINALCKDQMIAWMCRDGEAVAKGDPILVFDTSILQKRVAMEECDLRIAEASLQSQELRLAAELQSLKEESNALQADLAVARAALEKARRVDADQVALLRAEYERAAQRADDQQRVLETQQSLADLGELAADELATARLATRKAENDARLARLKWQRETDRIDDVAVAQLELEVRALLMKLGSDPAQPQPDEESTEPAEQKRGIARRIEALERKVESERAKNKAALDRARKELHEAVRDAFDHTALNFVEILGAESEEPVRRICFGKAGVKPPEHYLLDDGSPFDAERGYGWDRDMREWARRRDSGEPLQTGVVLVRNQATWRCALPDGEYRLRLGVGDAVDWHGPLVRHEGRVLFSVDKIETRQVVEQTVTVRDGELALVCGDKWDKAQRAPEDGVAGP